MAVVVAIGFTVLAVLATTVDTDLLRTNTALVAHLGAFVVVGQFFAIPISRNPRGPRILVNAPYTFALMLFGGLGFAALL
jgi:hypothetical protein